MDTFPRIGMVKKLAGEVERVKWRVWRLWVRWIGHINSENSLVKSKSLSCQKKRNLEYSEFWKFFVPLWRVATKGSVPKTPVTEIFR